MDPAPRQGAAWLSPLLSFPTATPCLSLSLPPAGAPLTLPDRNPAEGRLLHKQWRPQPAGAPDPSLSPQVSEMPPPPQKKRWESMAKGLLLGALFTSFLLLLYSYAAPPLHAGMTSS